MAVGDMPPLAEGAVAPKGGPQVAKATVGDMPPVKEGVPLEPGFDPNKYDRIDYDEHGKNPRGVMLPRATDFDPHSQLREDAMKIGAMFDKAWDFVVPPVTGALAVIGARVGFESTAIPRDGMTHDKEYRAAEDATSERNFQKFTAATSSPLTGPGHIFSLLGWHPEDSASVKKVQDYTKYFDEATSAALDAGAKGAAKVSAGWVTEGEANDVARVVMGFLSAEGVKGGVKALAPDRAKALQDDLNYMAETAKYKATRGDPTPAKSAATEMQWSGVKPEHQEALEKELHEAFEEAEARTKAKEGEPAKPQKPGDSLAGLAEAWNKDPEARTDEEHQALKKYFKDAEVPAEAEDAIKAAMKPQDELTAKDKGLLKKYAPPAVAGALGLAVWNSMDDSDEAKHTGMAVAAMAVGAMTPLGRRAVEAGRSIEELRSEMTGPSLKFIETLPAETREVSKQDIQAHLNKPGVAGPEAMLLKAIAEGIPEKGKISAEKLVESVAPTLAKWELVAEPVDKAAQHGLPAIDRFNPKGATTVLYKMAGSETFEIPTHIDGERALNHFPKDPGVFGHVRRFVENGVKHVVELQSDAFQQLSRTVGKSDPQAWAQVKEGLKKSADTLIGHMGFELTQERAYLRSGGSNGMKAKSVFNNAAEHLEGLFKKVDFHLGEKWLDSWSQRVNNAITEDEISVHFGQLTKELKPMLEQVKRVIEGSDPAKKWDAVSERLKPMQKFYSRRLIREELSDSFREREMAKHYVDEKMKELRPGEKPGSVVEQMTKAVDGFSKVRFATADTVAKVEDWRKLDASVLSEIKDELRETKALWNQFENGEADEGDLEKLDHTPRSLQKRIQALEAQIKRAGDKLAKGGDEPAFHPEHQGIYDRYKKETEQFLKSIGGQPYIDRDGHSWIEVPVENKGLGLGPRAHMAGFMDPKMVALLAGASLGALMGYKYQHSTSGGILGALLGAGAMVGGGRLLHRSLVGTDAVKHAVSELSDMLYATVQGSKADGLDMLNYIKNGLPSAYAKHAEAIADHLDNPRKFPLAAEAQKILDDVILPIQRANSAMVKALKHLGIDTEDIVPGRGSRRYFQGTSKGIAALGRELELGGRVGGKPSVSTRVAGSTDQAFASYKTMSGQSFVGKLGKDGVVDIWQNGKVVGKGQWNPRSQEMSYLGQKFRQTRPTMEDVETHTKMKYEREPLLTELDANLRLKSALANAYFLDNFKKMPGFSDWAFKPEPHEVVPEGWRSVPQLPQLRGYKFEPRIAEALEDFAGDQAKGFWHYASKVNRMFVGSMFWTPFLHIGNVAVHALAEKGVVGLATNMGVNLRTSLEAYKEVTNFGPKYRAYLRDGGSFMYPDQLMGDFTKSLLEALGKDKKNGPMLAKAFGYTNPFELVKRIYSISRKSLWKWNDVMMMQGYLEKEARGMQRDDAMRKTEAHVPSYRIPSRVLDSRALAQIMRESGPLSFARYDYGRLKSYGETIKDLVGKDKSLKDRSHALDQLAMLGLIMVAYDQLGDPVAQWLTGNPNATAMRLGSATIPQMIMDAWSGEADKRTPVTNLFHLSPVFELLPQVVANKDLYTGQEWAKTPAEGVGKLAQQFSPVKLVTDVTKDRNPSSPAQVLWAQLGIKDPSPEQVEKREKRKEKRLKEREE